MSNSSISLLIDGIEVSVAPGTSILNAATVIGIDIPTLCYLKELSPAGICRFCVVDVDYGPRAAIVTACSELCCQGMRVRTRSAAVIELRRSILSLLLSNHFSSCFSCTRNTECKDRQIPYCNYDQNCFTCEKHKSCKLREYCLEYGVYSTGYPNKVREKEMICSAGSFSYNPDRCILCRKCKRLCDNTLGAGIISVLNRGFDTELAMPFKNAKKLEVCETCGKCAEVCPTGALIGTKL